MKPLLMHGDCLERMQEIPAGSVDMVLADPPYGTTKNKWDSVIPLKNLWEQLSRVTKSNGVIVMTASQPFTTVLINSNMKMFKYCWVWDKKQITNFLNSKKQPLRRFEDVVIFYSIQCTYYPQMRQGDEYSKVRYYATDNYGYQTRSAGVSKGNAGRFPNSLIDVPQIRVKGGHPTQKPIALMEYLIKTYTNERETVLDFAMGSGTTGVACSNLGRKFIGIELDLDYFTAAQSRIDDTGASV